MTAFANYLFAHRAGVVYVLRVDDTDPARSERRYERSVHQDAEWLGLRFDEGPGIGGAYGPYRQSERGDLYARVADELLAGGGSTDNESASLKPRRLSGARTATTAAARRSRPTRRMAGPGRGSHSPCACAHPWARSRSRTPREGRS